MKVDPAAFPSTIANRVLERESWAREKLAPFAGRCARVEAFPFALLLGVAQGGRFEVGTGEPHVTIAVDGAQLPALLFDPQALLSTDLSLSPEQILAFFMRRWQMEPTFRHVREHLGVETQRQWSDKAIARTTPVLLGLFSFSRSWLIPCLLVNRVLCVLRLGTPKPCRLFPMLSPCFATACRPFLLFKCLLTLPI